MSSSESGEATFRISIDGNASIASKDIASSSRLAAKAIAEFENEAKVLSADLRRLKGNSDEVTAAKTALKKRIDEAKQSVSTLTMELTKQGTSYTAAAAAAKKYGDGVGRLPNLKSGAAKAVSALGKAIAPGTKKLAGALEPVTKKLGTMFAPVAKKVSTALAPAGRALAKFGGGAKQALAGVGKAAKEDAASVLPSLGSILGVVGTGSALAAAAVAAVGVAVVGAAAAVVAFGVSAADSAAKMGRQRQALLGNAQDAKAFGDQIAELAGKVPQGVEELNGLAVSLSKTRLSGRAMVDTMAAVAQASGAVDAEAGAKIQELITRGQNTGRFALQRLELQGTGIDFDDVAKEYAAGTKKSIEAARAELMRGEATLDAGAEAVKKATEKKFGDLNLKNAFSLENAPKKFFDQLKVLSSGVDLTPITKGLQDAFAQLSPDAPLGAAVKTFMETIGTGFADVAGKSIPVLIEGFKWLVVWALKIGTHFYEVKKKVMDAFDAGNWMGAGAEIVKGLYLGIFKSNNILFDAIRSLASTIKNAFTGEMEIHSPSRVFARYGENTVEGYAQGVERGSKRASGAVENMVQMPSAPAAQTAPSVDSIVVNIHGAPTGSVEAMQSPAFLAELTRAVRAALTARGVAA